MARLGRLASLGDEVLIGARRLRVEELDGHRVAQVSVSGAGRVTMTPT